MIASLPGIVWWAAGALSVAASAYLVLALAAVAAYRSRLGPGWTTPPKVTLLKPLCGLEDGLEDALASFVSQQLECPTCFVFGVASADDPALSLARAVAARFPDQDVSFVVDATVHGPNPKVSNLINMAQHDLGDVVVLSDSDIVIAPGVLQRTIDALSAPGLGAVTALYRSRPGTAGNRIKVMGSWFIDYWFLPMAVLHAKLVPLSVTYGPLTAVRGDVLTKIGGIEALAVHLSDDAELGRLVREAGWSLAFAPDIVDTLVNDANLRDLFDHELRWARTVRGLDLPGFTASVVSNPGPLPLLLLLRPGFAAAVGILVPIILHWLLARLVERRFGRSAGLPRPGLLAIWWRDIFCFLVWATAWGVKRVGWRGQRLEVDRGDVLQALPPGQFPTQKPSL